MLDKLSANQFLPLIGDTFTIVITNGPDIEVTLEQVKEAPHSKDPQASAEARTPFSLFFKGSPTMTLSDVGTYDIRHADFPGDIQNVMITRVIPAETENPQAWYQVIFS